MIELFRGQTDAYFSDGECIHEPLDMEVIDSHLAGHQNIGVYPVVDGQCWWGCADIDTDDIDAAERFAGTAEKLGLTCWTERSRSKGYHCWVFSYEPVSSVDMRAAMVFIDRLAATNIGELNPKGDGPFTNCVRLPYFAGPDPRRQVIIDSEGETVEMEQFIDEAMDFRVSAGTIEEIADRQRFWVQLKTVSAPAIGKRKGPRRAKPRSDTNAAKAYREEREIPEGERDETLFALTNYMCSPDSHNHDEETAKKEMERVWTKMVQNNQTYPLNTALEKVTRYFRQHTE